MRKFNQPAEDIPADHPYPVAIVGESLIIEDDDGGETSATFSRATWIKLSEGLPAYEAALRAARLKALAGDAIEAD